MPRSLQNPFIGNPGSRIPLGTLIAAPATSAKDEIVFETTQPGIVPPWGSAELPIQAVVASSEGNLAAQTITYLKQTISGITQVTNPAATVLGSDEEDDASLRERIIRTLQGLSRGTIPAILHGAIDFRLQEVTLKGSLPAGQNYITVAQDLNLFPFSVAGAGKLGLDGNKEVVTYTGINTASFPHKFTGVMRGQQGTSDIDHVDGIKLKEYIPTGHGERVTSASLIETHGHVDVYIDDGTMHGPHAELVSLVQKRLRGDGSDRDPGYRGAGITLDVIARSVVSITVEVQVVVDFAYDVASVKQAVQTAILSFINGFKVDQDVYAYQIAEVVMVVEGVTTITSLLINGVTFDGTDSADIYCSPVEVARTEPSKVTVS